ncbi:12619_t:CDS:2 [Funneliformis caledonium]|uniref:12619_t:CDS:1 n=1 Tax=Funneliformis caledonium TaxID=1117310 RepID=A0A9N9BZD5_9GLOM|nr:12619_t:CDS:2 [Funneliformis caledonium]
MNDKENKASHSRDTDKKQKVAEEEVRRTCVYKKYLLRKFRETP